jgi:hypothetical protein
MSTDTTTTQSTSSGGEAGNSAGATSATSTFTPEQEAAVARIVADSVAKALQASTAGGATGEVATSTETSEEDDPNAVIRARVEAMEAHSKKVQEQAKRAVLQRHLPNLISGEVLKLAPVIELTDEGDLTADSARKLEAWKLANPYYFKAAAAGTTAQPGSNGSGRGASSAETQARLRQAGIEPDAWRKKPGARVAMAMTGGVK